MAIMHIIHEMCMQAGLCQGTLEEITFLGIEIDSTTIEIRLPEDKLSHTLESQDFQACRKWNLLSLIGVLSHVSKVILDSRIFFSEALKKGTDPDYFIRLNIEVRSDIFQSLEWLNYDTTPVDATTDTGVWYLRWGCQLPYNSLLQSTHISAK